MWRYKQEEDSSKKKKELFNDSSTCAISVPYISKMEIAKQPRLES